MASLLPTGRLARWSARHPWLVICVWVVLVALAAAAATGLGDTLTAQDMDFTNNPESLQGARLLEDRLRGPEPELETVIVRSHTATFAEPAFRAVVERVTADLAGLDGIVASATSAYQAAALRPEAAATMVSPDRKAVLVSVNLAPGVAGDQKAAERFLQAVRAERAPGFEVLTVGSASISHELTQTAERDLRKAEIFGLPFALLVLVAVFGALVAAGVPLVLAFVAIFVAVGLTALVGRLFHLSFFVVNMISMVGLAVGIDYALFIVERYREERRRGLTKHEAISLAGGTASKAVLFSGITVVLALFGLFIIPMTTFRSLGAGAVLVVTVAVLAMLTLVPALLSLLGDGIDWPRFRRGPVGTQSRDNLRGPVGAEEATLAAPDTGAAVRGFWGMVTRVVMARPVVSVTLAAAVLLAAAVPYVQLQKGTGGPETLPEGDVKTAYRILSAEFSAGVLSPVEIVVDLAGSSAGTRGGVGARADAGKRARVAADIEQLVALLARDPAFVPAPRVEWNQDRGLALVTVPLRLVASSPQAQDAVWRLRDTIVPQAFGEAASRVYVTGSPAFNADSVRLIRNYTPVVFAFVLGLSFLLLLVAFRSLVVPIKAILMNLLSLGATYGILVLVFQKGVGLRLFGFQKVSTIESWIPIFLFCILFGLSMDYHVFLISRIREHFQLTRRNKESVTVGLQRSGRIITGAALIMVIVFSAFASGKLVMIQQMGFGLAVAIFLDATLVRSVLVPASMALLGNANWYLPVWLRWLPELHLEGGHRSPSEGRRDPSGGPEDL